MYLDNKDCHNDKINDRQSPVNKIFFSIKDLRIDDGCLEYTCKWPCVLCDTLAIH